MASQWYYTKEGQQMGAVSSFELKEMARTGKLKRTDLIWKDGMPTWGEAGSAHNLFPDEHVTARVAEAGERVVLGTQRDVQVTAAELRGECGVEAAVLLGDVKSVVRQQSRHPAS